MPCRTARGRSAVPSAGPSTIALADDPVLDVGTPAVSATLVCFELHALGQRVEQAPPATEQDVDDVDPDLVDEARREELLVAGWRP